MCDHILITTDGSELAAKGLDQGLALAKALNIKATVLTVTVPLTGFALEAVVQGQSIEYYDERVAAELEILAQSVRDKAAAVGIDVEFVGETDSSPPSTILRVAQERNCDLIVMSSHGRRGITRIMLGSQTIEVLTHSDIPVLVVK